MDNNIEELAEMIKELSEDRKIPKNVRKMIADAYDAVMDEGQTEKTRLSTAISLLDEASSDQNIPSFMRTEIWNLVTLLESVLNKL